MDARIERSAVAWSRVAGVLYLMIIVIGVLSEAFVRDGLIVPGDAVATATRIGESGLLWRASIAGQLAYLAFAVIVNQILYTLFVQVNRPVAQLAAAFNLVAIAVEASARLLLLAPVVLYGPSTALAALDPGQRAAVGYFFLRLHDYGFGVALVFFAGVCLAWGWLIRRSHFVPSSIGWLMQLAGACYLANSFALLLSPALSRAIFPAVLLPAFVAESAFCLWLMLRGVDASQWPAGTRPDTRLAPGDAA